MNHDLQERLYQLIALKLAGSANGAELRELEVLLESAPDFKYLLDQLKGFPQLDAAHAENLTDQAYAAHSVKMMYADKDVQLDANRGNLSRTGLAAGKVRLLRMGAVAATLIAALIMAQVFFFRKGQVEPTAVVEAPKALSDKSKLKLPDGTVVYLNANSNLEYDEHFNKTGRTVKLTGEAYFDVAHDAKKPFVVQTSRATIKVLGTEFNVKDYDDEAWEATLLKGKIEMFVNSKPREKLQLEPSQKVTVVKVKENIRSSKEALFKVAVSKVKPLDNNIVETAWKDNKLIFVDKPLVEIAKDLERSFAVNVIFESDKAKHQKYTGAFDTDNLLQILEILDLSNPFRYNLSDHTLIIK
ncbi:FecR family protein [Niabella insulamsoli]|uniref:FecR family protein n=1 Tax=Niabella insulamsoli TaxID=3144874 RepID=UPI0031FD2F74